MAPRLFCLISLSLSVKIKLYILMNLNVRLNFAEIELIEVKTYG